MKEHELKCINPFFSDIWNSKKDFDVRKNDRYFQVNDYLLLKEYNSEIHRYLKRKIYCRIKYILLAKDYPEGIKEGYCVLGLEIVDKSGKR